MKKNNLYLIVILHIIILTFTHNYIYCVPCGIITNCPDKAYRYHFCDKFTGNIVYICSKNPNNHGLGDDYTPVESRFPLCYIYQESGLYPNTIMLPFETGLRETFNKDYIEGDMTNGKNAWNCLCGWESLPCQCTVYVKFSISKMN
jgi:hypothetical protein